ncbi:hypothetical protein [Amycolatopsis regifaucium]|uniref:Uncharacterized protein n=1 Tax=Amycolatopsis regifaucium TaxID=546365 RepID=A0A154MPH8_9PSEU|nr:hypothetical protein [Amycolatopsis regifaucium]KZB85990.1 hypothetical protein AVL48_27705 [Amycolatopsis regifaucium]OKA04880.1 hypothetical protein ATP06_0227760 [Amycolatopsis regifaucium]SFH73916.1 hypothetical protein SAMN04489731_106113 [Amycolatopsis regifaucium]
MLSPAPWGSSASTAGGHPTLHWSAIYAKPVRTTESRIIRPCRRCAAKHGITTPVSILRRVDQPTCRRHGTWLIDFPNAAPFSAAEAREVAGLKTSRDAAARKLLNLDKLRERPPAGLVNLGIPIVSGHRG